MASLPLHQQSRAKARSFVLQMIESFANDAVVRSAVLPDSKDRQSTRAALCCLLQYTLKYRRVGWSAFIASELPYRLLVWNQLLWTTHNVHFWLMWGPSDQSVGFAIRTCQQFLGNRRKTLGHIHTRKTSVAKNATEQGFAAKSNSCESIQNPSLIKANTSYLKASDSVWQMSVFWNTLK